MLEHEFAEPITPSRVVVLGERGFVARRLIAWLHDRGIPVRAIGSAEVDLVGPGASDTLERVLKPGDAIVFASALTPEKGRDRASFFKNIAMADHVCGVLARARCAHLVYISSDSVYGPRRTDIDEAACCEPTEMYPLSHLVREKLLLDTCSAAGVRLAILRPTAIYGATDTHNSYGPNRFVRSALQENRITLFGQGEEERDHIYVDDVVELIGLCLVRRSAGILNAASGTALSFAEVARVIAALIGRPVVVEFAPRRVPLLHRRFRTSALTSAFPDFRPTPLNAGIRRMLGDLAMAADQGIGGKDDPPARV